MTGLWRLDGAFVRSLVEDCRAFGDRLEVAQCRDRCTPCERGLVAEADGAWGFYPRRKIGDFFSDLKEVR